MRKAGLALAAVAVIGGAVLAGGAVMLNRIIERDRNRILEGVQAKLGRPLGVGKITVSVWGGLGMRLENVWVGDDQRFSTSEFVRGAAVTVRVSVWPLLFRRVQISGIELARPHVQLIRDSGGHWNYESIGTVGPAASMRSSSMPTLVLVAETAPTQQSFSIDHLSIEDGAVAVTDRSKNPVETTTVQHIDLALSYASAVAPIPFSVSAAYEADAHNIHLKGRLQGPDKPLPPGVRAAVDVEMDGSLGPLGPHGIVVDDLHLKGAVTSNSVRLTHVDGHALGGAFTLTAEYSLRDHAPAVVAGRFQDIDVSKLAAVVRPEDAERVRGVGMLTVNLHAPALDAAQVVGTIAADVHDGVIRDFNIVNEVLGRVTDLPSIGALISKNVRPKYARIFATPDTRFQTLHGTFQLAEQRLRTDDLAIIATDYGVRATGWVNLQREIDLAGTLEMSKQFSDDVVSDVRAARYLFDDKAQLAVPFRLRGKLGEAKLRPDSEALIHRLSQAAAAGGAEDLLGSVLRGHPHGQATPGSDDLRNRIERGLRDFFGR